MLPHPRLLAALINSSIGQYLSKHQWTIDCLIRPFLTAGPWSAAALAAARPSLPPPVASPVTPNIAAPAVPLSRPRRLVPRIAFDAFRFGFMAAAILRKSL